jgi:hypothetical protein
MLDKLNKLSLLREKFIDAKRRLLASKVDALQKALYAELIDSVITALDTDGKTIANTNENLMRISQVDKVFDKYQQELAVIMGVVSSNYLELLNLNETYFNEMGSNVFKTVTNNVNSRMRARVGLNSKGGLVKDGFIDSFIKDRTVANQIKQQLLSAVVNGAPSKTITKELGKYIIGVPNASSGIVENQFQTYIYDSYSQFDRETGNVFAIELDLNSMVYAGGLVEHSREFCIIRNGRAFTRDEVSKFGTPDDKFGGYTNKSRGEFKGKNKNYIPERDLGGYNCGHTGNWVTYEIARSIRPDIPKYKKAA